MTNKLQPTGLAIATLMTTSLMADAQSQRCGPRTAIVEKLAQKYGETRQSMGLAANNAVIEVFASDDTGTWTITVTGTNGLTCLVASGQAYEQLAEALPAAGTDS